MHIADLGPDAIGLNFYPQSVRYVEPSIAQEIAQSVPSSVLLVGVFVNAPLEEVIRCARNVPLGDESAEEISRFSQLCPETMVIRAGRRDARGLQPIIDHLADCTRSGARISACLIDAHTGSAYGGTGITLPWQELRKELDQQVLPPVILAGGLRPGNVAEAISLVQPWGIDVASGVESQPGVKDVALVKQLMAAVEQV